MLAVIYDPEAPNGFVANIHQVRRVAWLLRDRISLDAWLILNSSISSSRRGRPPEAMQVGAAQDLLDHAVITLSAFGGLVMESMTRGDGWRFLDIGRRLERALQMIELLRNSLGPATPENFGVLEAVLEMADSSITYRSRYLTSMQTDLVLDLLLVDEANPRSIAFQLARLREQSNSFPGSQTAIGVPRKRGWRSLCLPPCSSPMCAKWRVRHDAREALLARLAADLTRFSETLTRAYFSHAMQSRQLATS